jgi:hypothetical protein
VSARSLRLIQVAMSISLRRPPAALRVRRARRPCIDGCPATDAVLRLSVPLRRQIPS